MRSIMEPRRGYSCFMCGYTLNLEEHHIFGGPDREISEKFGLKVHLCPFCHRDSKEGVHYNRENQEKLFVEGKKAFYKHYPGLRFLDYFRKEYVEVEKNVDLPVCEVDFKVAPAAGFILLDEEEIKL